MDPVVLAEIALGLGAVALVVAAYSVLALSKARRQLAKITLSSAELDLAEFASVQIDGIEENRRALAKLSQKLNDVQGEVASSLRHLAVVRFNALSEMGGRFSFAVALLDDSSTGIVLTSIQGHQQGRLYAKAVFEGECEVPLSPEETEAINNARPRKHS